MRTPPLQKRPCEPVPVENEHKPALEPSSTFRRQVERNASQQANQQGNQKGHQQRQRRYAASPQNLQTESTTPTRSRPRSRRRGSAAVRLCSWLLVLTNEISTSGPSSAHSRPEPTAHGSLYVWLRFSCYWLTVRPNFGLQSADLLLGVPLKTGLGSSARTSGNNPQQTSPLFS